MGVGFGRHRACLFGSFDNAQPVAQPLHGGPGDKDRAFKGVGGFAVELVGDGGEQTVFDLTALSPVLSMAKQPVP